MKFNEEDFDMMLNAAWSAFENTLFVWGVTQEQIDHFSEKVYAHEGYAAVSNSLEEVIEWRD